MRRSRFLFVLGALLASLFVGACATRPSPPIPKPEPPVCDYRDTHIYTLDELSRPIPGVRITQPSTGRVDVSDGAGYSHRPACGSEVYTVELEGWHAVAVDLAGGVTPHNVHLTRIPPLPPTHPDPVAGAIWSDRNGCFGDDNGCRNFTIWHYGDALGRWAAGGHASVLRDFDRGAEQGFHIIRMWSHIRPSGGSSPWAHGGDPPYDGWNLLDEHVYRSLVELTNAAAERGMRVTLETGGIDRIGTADEQRLMQQLNRAAHETGAWKVAWFAPVNEPGSTHATSDDNGDNTPAHLKRLVDIARAGTQTLWHLGGTDNEKWDDPRDRFSQKFYTHPDQTFGYYHGTRALRWFDKIRRPFTWYYEERDGGRVLPGGFIRKWVDGEPFGLPCGAGPPLRTVTVVQNCHEVDVELIALSVAIKTFRGMSALMSGNGVQRHQDWDRVIGWREVPWLIRQIPRDVATYTWVHHSGDSHRDKRVLAAKDEIRIDGARHADGRYAYLIYGPKTGGTAQLRIDRSFTGKLCDAALMSCEDVSGQAGGTFPVTFSKGRLFVGRVH